MREVGEPKGRGGEFFPEPGPEPASCFREGAPEEGGVEAEVVEGALMDEAPE